MPDLHSHPHGALFRVFDGPYFMGGKADFGGKGQTDGENVDLNQAESVWLLLGYSWLAF